MASALSLLSGACAEAHGRPGGADDAGCVLVVPDAGEPEQAEMVDLLFMVDNSNSMTEEQESLARALPAFVSAILAGDTNLDGVPDFPPVGSLHIGVITSDMGTGGITVPTCEASMHGDDGVLGAAGPGAASCADGLPRFLEHRPGRTDVSELAADAACMTTVGTGGCGFEQQLEAVLKALTPYSADTRFFGDTVGHGGSENTGFLRRESVLAVVVVTDENDCSAADPEIYSPFSRTYTTDLNVRCFHHAEEALHPVSRYVEGLIALRRARPNRLVLATIAGVPADLSGQSAARILEDERLQERVDDRMLTRLAPSCDVPGRGLAFPPVRLLETARGLRARGARTTNLSICVEDFSPAVRLVLEEIAVAASAVCE